MISGVWLRRAVTVVVLGVLSAGAAGARADDDGRGAGGPGRAVRLSNVDGQVQVSQGGEVLADQAVVNTPLFEGSQVATGDDGRAEIQFEDGSVVRIPPDSSLTLTVLRPTGETEMSLDSGMGYFELQGENHGSMRVRFESSVVTPNGFTVLRVKLDEGPAELAVFSGNAHVDATNGTSLDLRGGQSITLGSLTVADTIQQDSWDAWNSDRDQAMTSEDVGSAPPTSGVPDSNNPAWGDLNANGTWYNVPDQGYVWSPYDASNPDWDPYGVGNWMWTPGYGYVWVSGYPWGYLPYSCGAWSWYGGFGWGWAPGGCSPWWGGAGWGFNFGYVPTWYRLPSRPHYPRPRPVSPGVMVANPGQHHPPLGLRPVAPVVAVNRHEPSSVAALPAREPGRPVQFGSVVAQPVRPTPTVPVARPGGGATMGYTHDLPRSTKPLNGPPTVGAMPGRGSGYEGTYRPMPAPTTPMPRYSPPPSNPRPVYTPAPRPAPAPAPRPSAPSAPHGGGGGGNPHK